MATTELEKVECEGGHYYKHPGAYIEEGAVIGPETKIWDEAHIFPEAIIGNSCTIGAGVHVENQVELGSYSRIQRGVVLYKGVKTGDYVFFGPNATTTNDRNPRAFGDWELSETIIETGASIGANATLIAGNRIGPFALVGAGSVVTKPVRGCEVVSGNPASFRGWANVAGHVVSKSELVPEDVETILKDPVAAIARYLSELETT